MSLPSAQDLSELFVENVRDFTSPNEWKLMDERNESDPNDSICHSHDFCDANVAMIEAFKTLGVDEDLVCGQNEEVMALWDEAWGIAKESGFYCEYEERRENRAMDSPG